MPVIVLLILVILPIVVTTMAFRHPSFGSKTRKAIGCIFLLLTAGLAAFCIHFHIRTNNAFNAAQNEVLLKLNGKTVGTTATFTITYAKSHGGTVEGCDYWETTPFAQANVEMIHQGGGSCFLQFNQGSTARFSAAYNNPITVKVIKPFPGEMAFKNLVCGCEKLAAFFLNLVAVPLGLLYTALGVLLIVKSPSPRPMPAASQGR